MIDYLSRAFSEFPQEEWLDRIESKLVLLDGVPASQDAILRTGCILSWMRQPWEEPEVPGSFAILYRDRYLLGIAKPTGLPTVPGGGLFMDHTLLSFVRRHFPEANPLHRLGRGTSGVVLFALASEAASKISQAWSSGQVLKIYRALASGLVLNAEFEVNTPIGPVPHRLLKTIHASCPYGKAAHSYFRVLEHREASTLLEARITTGRPHQIRIHTAVAGHPLIGDPLYVTGGIPAENTCALPGDLGYHLHSTLLAFPHPVTGKWTEIGCLPPPLLRLTNEKS
jgi:23S rRNA pseudouridine1911/1915/1917 synthase